MKERSILLVCLLCIFSFASVSAGGLRASEPNSARVASVNDDKADLQAYYNDVESKFLLMTDPTYNDAAFTAEQKDALASELEKVKSALDSGSGDYSALLAELKTVYEKVPYVEGGKKWWAITPEAVKDGAQMMFECGPTDHRNKFMKAYPQSLNGNSVMCNDLGKSKTVIWQLVATGSKDAIYTGKPTYYLKDVTSGKYIGVSDALTSIDPGHRRMVDNTDMAYPFCFLTAGEINAQEGRSMNTYGNKDAIFIHHSNADGTWFRLSRFGGYQFVFYISSGSYPTNNDWQAWNMYTSETNLDITGELEQAIQQYGTLNIPAGDAPGYYSKQQADHYNNALAAAKAVTDATPRLEVRNAIDSLASAYETGSNLTPIPLTEGYYRINSAYTDFTSTGKEICAYDRGDGYLGWHTAKAGEPKDVFKLTKTDGGWFVQNAATDKYVGVATDENKITMADEASSVQTFASSKEAQWKWSNNTTPFTYYVVGSDPGYMGRYYQQGLGGFDSWQFEKVDSAWIESVTVGLAKDSLAAYYNNMKDNVMPYVNANDYAADKVEAFEKACKTAGLAVNGTDKHSSSEYKAMLNDLKEAYSNLGFAQGGGSKITTRLGVGEIKDGSTIAIEAASSQSLKGYFLKGQPQYRNELYAWVFKPGLDKDGVWVVEKAPMADKKNGKPTYYLKQQSTGLYIGKNGTGTNGFQTRALVANTDSAYNFSLVSATEAGCTTYHGQKNWDENSVTFLYSNTATQSLNLSNYPGSPDFVWLFENSTDVIAWNVYNVEYSKDLKEEYAKTMARCDGFQPEATGGYGFYDPEQVEAYQKAYNDAKALTADNSRIEYRNAIDSLDAAYNNLIATGISSVSSGYFYITNRAKAYTDANGGNAALAVSGEKVVYKKFDSGSYESVFHVTGNKDEWNIQSFATGEYLASKDGKTLTVSENKENTFAMNLLGLYKASMAASNSKEFFTVAVDESGDVATTTDSGADGASWTFVRVSEDKLAEIRKSHAHDMLGKLIETASQYNDSLGKGKYNDAKEKAFAASYESAKKAYENTLSNQKSYENAYNSLGDAIGALKASRIYVEGSPISNLARYVDSIKADIPHISSKYYDAKAVETLKTAWNTAKEAIDKENLDSAGYVGTLNNLRAAYEAVGYVYGGYYPRVNPEKLTDGDIIMIEAAASQYNLGLYMKQTVDANNNSDIRYTEGRDSKSVWKLVDAGKLDKMNSKTTYYLQNVETGMYIGYGNSYTSKAMVNSTDKAMNFSILTAKDIKFNTYLDETTGIDGQSVTFQFSYSNSGFVRLGNFIAYGQGAYYVTDDNWKHVIAWNVYSAEFEDDIKGEYNEEMKTYRTFRVDSNDSPGSYSAEVAESYAKALAYANSAEGSDARIDYRLAIDSVRNMYDKVKRSKYNPVTEGTYYMISNFSSFEDAGIQMGVYAKESSLKWREIDYSDKMFMYEFKKGSKGGWTVRNLGTGAYVGNSNGNAIALINASGVEQKFAYIGGGEFTWANEKSDNTYYPDGYTGDFGNIKSAGAHGSYRAVDAWQIKRVPQEVLDSIETANSAKLLNRTLVVEGKSKINWIKAQARNVGQLNIMAIDTRKAELDSDVTYETLSEISSNENCLFYVSDNSDISGANVVKNGVCENLQLVDAPFYCPESFTAKRATYSLNPVYATKSGGWQTVAVPFEVSSASASSAGDIAIESVGASGNMFVREFTGIEDNIINFGKLAEAKMSANTPYALAVPGAEFGDKSLENETITFEGVDVRVDSLPADAGVKQGNYSFVPTFENNPVHKAWILNYEGNGFDSWTNGTPLCFRGYFTSVDPEAYAKGEFTFSTDTQQGAASKKLLRIAGLSLDGEVTGLTTTQKQSTEIRAAKGGIQISTAQPAKITVFDAEGKTVFCDTVNGNKTIALQKGVYVVNSRKVLVK